MINIINKKDCVGCHACVQRCPKSCISMKEDEQGFLYPVVDINLCIDCHICEKVCPVINQSESRNPLLTYAAKNKNLEIKRRSSSGGVFYALAEAIINDGGVVFGAKFNEAWDVVHDYAETLEGVIAFQGSKYVQSHIGDSYLQAEKFLKSGRKVMFTGTPCQIAGLRLFLRKDYDGQLLTVDLVCHGVPSPGVWKKYLKYITRPKGALDGKNTVSQSTLNRQMSVITDISFRDKRLGWEKFGFAVHAVARKGDKNSVPQSKNGFSEEQELLFEPHYENLFMQGFLKDLYLRPSCYDCPTKSGKSHADITLADFWGIQKYYPRYYSEGYYSLLLVRTKIGHEILASLNSIILQETSYEMALRGNPAIERSAVKPKQYDTFWELFSETGISAVSTVVTAMRPTLLMRVYWKSRRIFAQILRKIKILK